MNDIELNLIPLWELIIERNFLIHINHNFIKNDGQSSNKDFHFMKSLLHFVPTVSPFYYHSLNNSKKIGIHFLTEALKHSMKSVAVYNPKLFLEWSPNKIDNLETHEDITTQV